MNQDGDKVQLQPHENDIISQITNNFPIDTSHVPTILQAFFPNTGMDSRTSRGSWTQQEDELLRTAVSQLSTKKWSDIAKFVPTRTSKQCRERWFNRLDPSLKHGPFEQWEDQIIIEKQKEVGNRWSIIAQLIPGRSPGSIKNRWHSGLKNAGTVNFNVSALQDASLDSLTMLSHEQGNDRQNNPEL